MESITALGILSSRVLLTGQGALTPVQALVPGTTMFDAHRDGKLSFHGDHSALSD